MTDPIKILKTVQKMADEGVVIEQSFKVGEFFDGGELQIRVDSYSESECKQRGLDPKNEANQLFCQGKFFTEDGREFHFVLKVSKAGWDLKMLQAELNSWNASTITYTLPTTQIFLNELSKALDDMAKKRA